MGSESVFVAVAMLIALLITSRVRYRLGYIKGYGEALDWVKGQAQDMIRDRTVAEQMAAFAAERERRMKART